VYQHLMVKAHTAHTAEHTATRLDMPQRTAPNKAQSCLTAAHLQVRGAIPKHDECL